jgi:hypothetical protein
MSNKPILFYSPNCKHCINIWNELKQKNIIENIIKVNVNNTNNIPSNITKVPSLLINKRPPIEGDGILLYFNNTSSDNVSDQNKSKSKTIQENTKSGIEDYMPSEMGTRYSDQYSFIDSDNPINHSYTFLDGSGNIPNSPVQQNPTSEGSAKNSKQNIMEQRLEQLKQSRDSELNIR